MKESGWLTRSIEQLHPFTNDFPGRINKANLKMAFLTILDEVETKNVSSLDYLVGIFTQSIIEKQKRTVKVINPIDKEVQKKLVTLLLEIKLQMKYMKLLRLNLI